MDNTMRIMATAICYGVAGIIIGAVAGGVIGTIVGYISGNVKETIAFGSWYAAIVFRVHMQIYEVAYVHSPWQERAYARFRHA